MKKNRTYLIISLLVISLIALIIIPVTMAMKRNDLTDFDLYSETIDSGKIAEPARTEDADTKEESADVKSAKKYSVQNNNTTDGTDCNTTAESKTVKMPQTATKQQNATKAPETSTKAPQASTSAPRTSTDASQTTTSGGNNSGVLAYEKQVVDLVNKERAANGLAPLTLNEKLCGVARTKSQDMKDLGYFSHTSPTYGSPFDMMKSFGISYRTAGENIAMGQRTPEEVVNAWMNSPGHRANILNPSFTQIGVGYVANGNYWTQMFIG